MTGISGTYNSNLDIIQTTHEADDEGKLHACRSGYDTTHDYKWIMVHGK